MATSLYLTTVASGVGSYSLMQINTRGASSTAVEIGTGFSNSSFPVTWVTPPLQAVTISGTITANIWMRESSMSADGFAEIDLYRYDVFSRVLLATRGTELGTTHTAQNWSGTPTSMVLADGNRLVLYVAAPMISGAYESWMTYDRDTAGVSGDSYITLTETLTEYTPPSSVPTNVSANVGSSFPTTGAVSFGAGDL